LLFFSNETQSFSAFNLAIPLIEVGFVLLSSLTHSPLWSPYTLVADRYVIQFILEFFINFEKFFITMSSFFSGGIETKT
jgi:hypothetical protein